MRKRDLGQQWGREKGIEKRGSKRGCEEETWGGNGIEKMGKKSCCKEGILGVAMGRGKRKEDREKGRELQ